jgi:hypothetical protein
MEKFLQCEPLGWQTVDSEKSRFLPVKSRREPGFFKANINTSVEKNSSHRSGRGCKPTGYLISTLPWK